MKKVKGELKSGTRVVSYRVADALYAQLEEWAKTQTDEAGLVLNASTAARRLMNWALDRKDEVADTFELKNKRKEK